MVDKVNRIAIVDPERCKPKKCNQECRKSCPVAGGRCIEVTPKDVIALISEQLCIGCNRCTKTCPFGAIKIIKDLPTEMNSNMIHRYGANTFKLHRLPIPRPGQVLGLVGTNGIGKTTALRILSGKLKPNLGRFKNPPDWSEIRNHFRGSELQSYFTRLLEDNLKVFTKPQNIDDLRRKMKGTVRYYLDQSYYWERVVELCNDLELNEVLDRKVCNLSGGEIQRFAIAVTAATKADIYMIDEPSNYLDVRQKMKAAQVIRSLLTPTTYVIVVEHDLSVLDYMSDFVCCLYGVPTAYGVVTAPFSVREGINVFLAGFIPTENQRFRKEALSFKVSETPQGSADEVQSYARYKYPHMCKTRDEFKLCVMDGEFTDSQILVMLGENGTGKTTFIRMLANKLKPDSKVSEVGLPKLTVSHKTQEVRFDDEESTVRDLLYRIPLNDRQFNSDVMKPLLIDTLMDRKLGTLSGGESQRVALCMCLGKPADIYLIDEPSASLDSEQRFIASKVIKRFILHAKKTAFVVEHDLGMATYLADRVIVFEGKPSVDCTANSPEAVSTGMNRFLSKLGITFRRDPVNHRPRVNKMGSNKDQEQKLSGRYFHLDD